MIVEDIKKADSNDFNAFILSDGKKEKMTDLRWGKQKKSEQQCDKILKDSILSTARASNMKCKLAKMRVLYAENKL